MTSSLKCSECGTPLSKGRLDALLADHVVQCGNCTRFVHHGNVEVETQPSSVRLRDDDDYALGSNWWHGTVKEGWGDWIDSSPTSPNVHLGTYSASVTRRSAFLNTMDWHIFRVKIKPGVIITPEIEKDGYYNAVETDEGYVRRYLNMWESPGSISLVAAKGDVEVTEHRVLPVGSWSARLITHY